MKRLGFRGVLDLLRSESEKTYPELADYVDASVMALLIMQQEEAVSFNEIAYLAQTSLYRRIKEYFPQGWMLGSRPEWQLACTYSDWLMCLPPELMDNSRLKAKRVWRLLINDIKPPVGWIPSSYSDKILQDAFMHWDGEKP